jgi:hypothetical protein
MDDFKIRPRHPKTLMPCDPCIEWMMSLAKMGELRPCCYCEHNATCAIIDGMYVHLHQAYSKDHAFEIISALNADAAAGLNEMAQMIVMAAVDPLQGDTRPRTLEQIRAILDRDSYGTKKQ